MRIVIVGGGYAGVTCALRLARKAPDGTGITLVNATDRFVERIRLHELAAGRRNPEQDLRQVLGPSVRLEVGRVTALAPGLHELEVDGRRIAWDRLVIALGSHTDRAAVPGIAEHAFTLDTGSAAALRDAVSRGGRLVVVGGGLTAIEGASEIAEAFPSLRVTLLSRGAIGEGWSEAGRTHVRSALHRLGIDVREGVQVTRVVRGGVETASGRVDADATLWAGGFAFSPLPREAGLAVDARGRVLVDPFLASVSHPDVFAAGDCAVPVEPPGDPLPLGCKTAMPTGAHVADTLARTLHGRPARPFDFAAGVFCISLGRHDGLVQFSKDAQPTGRAVTGRRAAWIKELICRGTMWGLTAERLGAPGVAWLRTGRVASREVVGSAG